MHPRLIADTSGPVAPSFLISMAEMISLVAADLKRPVAVKSQPIGVGDRRA
jgi:hypothetical protein